MRKLIAGLKLSLDGKYEGADGIAEWVQGWSEDYGLTPQIDACVLGAGMYPGYEGYWTAIQNAPDKPHPMTGAMPTPGEVDWAKFAALTPHYVLSSKLHETRWPNTKFLRRIEDLAALLEQPGKDIFLVGGGRTVANLIDAGLLDELRLILYPLIASGGKPLFTTKRRRVLALRSSQHDPDGRVLLTYALP